LESLIEYNSTATNNWTNVLLEWKRTTSAASNTQEWAATTR